MLVAAIFGVYILMSTVAGASEDIYSKALAKFLRRQLIKDNYDYMSSESEEASIRIYRASRKQNQKYDTKTQEQKSLIDDVKREVNDAIKNSKKNDHIISDIEPVNENFEHFVRKKSDKKLNNKTILYESYRANSNSMRRNKYLYEDEISVDLFDDTTTAKYKVIKVRGFRRSGVPGTLIQEETPESVAIVNLGKGPFPQFRLPHSRRQYMHDPLDLGVFDDDEELPPPPVNGTEPGVTEDVNKNKKTNSKTTKWVNNRQRPKTSKTTKFDGKIQMAMKSETTQSSSLRYTVGDNEIFVL